VEQAVQHLLGHEQDLGKSRVVEFPPQGDLDDFEFLPQRVGRQVDVNPVQVGALRPRPLPRPFDKGSVEREVSSDRLLDIGAQHCCQQRNRQMVGGVALEPVPPIDRHRHAWRRPLAPLVDRRHQAPDPPRLYGPGVGVQHHDPRRIKLQRRIEDLEDVGALARPCRCRFDQQPLCRGGACQEGGRGPILATVVGNDDDAVPLGEGRGQPLVDRRGDSGDGARLVQRRKPNDSGCLHMPPPIWLLPAQQ